MTDYLKLFERDEFAKLTGIQLISVAPGRAVTQMDVKPHHLNALGCVQGGALFTLADLAFGAASNSRGQVALAINVSMTFMKAVKTGRLKAEARELSFNAKLGTYTVDVTNEQNELVAVFQGLAYRKKHTHAPA